MCGYIVNDSHRFTWDHKFQTFLVTFAGRADIRYEHIDDPSYEERMRKAVLRLAPRLGLVVQRPARQKSKASK